MMFFFFFRRCFVCAFRCWLHKYTWLEASLSFRNQKWRREVIEWMHSGDGEKWTMAQRLHGQSGQQILGILRSHTNRTNVHISTIMTVSILYLYSSARLVKRANTFRVIWRNCCHLMIALFQKWAGRFFVINRWRLIIKIRSVNSSCIFSE